jgi:hypothetical protein
MLPGPAELLILLVFFILPLYLLYRLARWAYSRSKSNEDP